jgi:hypothetical protein
MEERRWIGVLVTNARKGPCLWGFLPESGGDRTLAGKLEAGVSAFDVGQAGAIMTTVVC